MTIEKAIRVKVGDLVWCPPDRGDDGFRGTVTYVDSGIHNIGNKQFIWIEVQRPNSHKSVWPSNRLGAA